MKKRHSKAISVFLSCMLVISNNFNVFALLFSTPRHTFEEPLPNSFEWSGNISGGLRGDGTEENPYKISNAGDLAYIAKRLETEDCQTCFGNGREEKPVFKFTHNIDFGFADTWEPIGNTEHPFSGVVHGENAVLKNLVVENTKGEDVSIFGCVVDSQISDLTISSTVILTSVGREAISTEKRDRADQKLNDLNSAGYDAIGKDTYYDVSSAGLVPSGGSDDVEPATAASSDEISEKFRPDCRRQIFPCYYNILYGEKEDGLDSSNADVKVLTPDNKCKYARLNMGDLNGGSVGIFGSVSGTSTLCGIKNFGTLSSYGGSFYIKNILSDGDRLADVLGLKFKGRDNRVKPIKIEDIDEYDGWDCDVYGSDALTKEKLVELDKKISGSDSVDVTLVENRMRDNITRLKFNCMNLMVDSENQENYVYAVNRKRLFAHDGTGGSGGPVGIVSRTRSTGFEEDQVVMKDCVNNGEISSVGGTSGRYINDSSEMGTDKGGNGGDAGGLVGNSLSNMKIDNCENNGRIFSNGGGSKSNFNKEEGVNGVFESQGGKGGCAGGFIGAADDCDGMDACIEFTGKCINTGDVESVSGENPDSSAGSSAAQNFNRGSGRRSSACCLGSGGDGGKAGGFIGKNDADVVLSSESVNRGRINTDGTIGGGEGLNAKTYNFGGSGGVSGGIIGYAAGKVTIRNKTQNNGTVTANGGRALKIKGGRGNDRCGNGGNAGGLIGQADKEVSIKPDMVTEERGNNFVGMIANAGTVCAVGGKSDEGVEPGHCGTAGALIGTSESKVEVDGFVNESSAQVDSSGSGGAEGNAGMIGCAGSDFKISNSVNRGTIKSDGKAGFAGAKGNVEIRNCQNIGRISSKSEVAAFLTGVESGKKAEILNSSNIGEISSESGQSGFVIHNAGKVKIDNTYAVMGKSRVMESTSGLTCKNFYLDSNSERNETLTTGMSAKDSQDMKSKDFAKELNKNAIKANKDLTAEGFYCGWMLGEAESNGYVLVSPDMLPDAAYEVVMADDEERVMRALKDRSDNEPKCEHNLPDEDGTGEVTGTGTADDPILIHTAAQLQGIRCWESEGKYYKLTHNIDASKNFSKIGSDTNPFKGVILGNGAIIRNLSVTFISRMEGAEIRDLLFDSSCVIQSDRGVIKEAVGQNTFINIENDAAILRSSCSSDSRGFIASASPAERADAGEDGGTLGSVSLINCVNRGEVFTIGGESGRSGDVGGFIGNATCKVRILNCRNEGNISTLGLGGGKATPDVNDVLKAADGKAGNAGGFVGAIDGGEGISIGGECVNTGEIRATYLKYQGTTGGFTGCTVSGRGGCTGMGADGGNAGGFVGFCTSDVKIEQGSKCRNYGRIIADGGLGGSTGLCNQRTWNNTVTFDPDYSDYSKDNDRGTGRIAGDSAGGAGGNAGGLIGNCGGNINVYAWFSNYADISANGGSGGRYGRVKNSEGEYVDRIGRGGNGGNAGGIAGLANNVNSTYNTENHGSVSAKGGNGGNPCYEAEFYQFTKADGSPLQFTEGWTEDSGGTKTYSRYLWYGGENTVISTSSNVAPTPSNYDRSGDGRFTMVDGSLACCINDKDKMAERAAKGRTLRTIFVDGYELTIEDGNLRQTNVIARAAGRGIFEHTPNVCSVGNRRFSHFTTIPVNDGKDDKDDNKMLHDSKGRWLLVTEDKKYPIMLVGSETDTKCNDIPSIGLTYTSSVEGGEINLELGGNFSLYDGSDLKYCCYNNKWYKASGSSVSSSAIFYKGMYNPGGTDGAQHTKGEIEGSRDGRYYYTKKDDGSLDKQYYTYCGSYGGQKYFTLTEGVPTPGNRYSLQPGGQHVELKVETINDDKMLFGTSGNSDLKYFRHEGKWYGASIADPEPTGTWHEGLIGASGADVAVADSVIDKWYYTGSGDSAVQYYVCNNDSGKCIYKMQEISAAPEAGDYRMDRCGGTYAKFIGDKLYAFPRKVRLGTLPLDGRCLASGGELKYYSEGDNLYKASPVAFSPMVLCMNSDGFEGYLNWNSESMQIPDGKYYAKAGGNRSEEYAAYGGKLYKLARTNGYAPGSYELISGHKLEVSENGALKFTVVSSDSESNGKCIVCPVVKGDGIMLDESGEAVCYKKGEDTNVVISKIRLGAKSQTIEDADVAPEDLAVYQKKLVAKPYTVDAKGGNGGNGGCAGSLMGKTTGSVQVNEFLSADGVTVDASCGLGGIGQVAEEYNTEAVNGSNGNGGCAGLIGKVARKDQSIEAPVSLSSGDPGSGDSQGNTENSAETQNNAENSVKLLNIQCKKCKIKADGKEGSVGLVGESENKMELANSFIVGSLEAGSGYSGLVGKSAGGLDVENVYSSCEMEADCKGKVCGSSSSENKVHNFYCNKDLMEGVAMYGDSGKSRMAPRVPAGANELTDEQMKQVGFIGRLNSNAVAYNANRGYSSADPTEKAEGWARNSWEQYPHLVNYSIDAEKMLNERGRAPRLAYMSDTGVRLVSEEGYEYSMDKVNWQDSSGFGGLEPLTTYKFYMREKAGVSVSPGKISEPIQVRTIPTEVYREIGAAREWIVDEKTGLNFIFACSARVDGMTVISVEEGDKNNFNYVLFDNYKRSEREKYYNIKMFDYEGNPVVEPGSFAMLLPMPDEFNVKSSCVASADGKIFDSNNNIFPMDGSMYYMVTSGRFENTGSIEEPEKLPEEKPEKQPESKPEKTSGSAPAKVTNGSGASQGQTDATGEQSSIYYGCLTSFISSALIMVYLGRKRRKCGE